MTNTPVPDPGHPLRYPIRVDDAWRLTCRCHWWQIVAAPVAEEPK